MHKSYLQQRLLQPQLPVLQQTTPLTRRPLRNRKTTEEQKVTVTTQELPATNNPNPNVTTAGPADQPAASEAATEDKDGKKTTKSTSTR